MKSDSTGTDGPGWDALFGWFFCVASLAAYLVASDVPLVRAITSSGFVVT